MSGTLAAIKERAAANAVPRQNHAYCVSTSGTAAVFVVPTECQGRFCNVTASGAAVDFILGSSISMTVPVYAQTSTLDGTTKALTVSAATGDHIPQDTTRRILFPANDQLTVCAHIASGAGKIYISVAE
jgi:hypothetical protein